jgi:hypothetical protein
MNRQFETLDLLTGRLAKEALHELGDEPFDEPDDYAKQCDYAGCYPWVAEVICAHPHDYSVVAALRGGDAAAEELGF